MSVSTKEREHMKKYKASPQKRYTQSTGRMLDSSGESFTLNSLNMSHENEHDEPITIHTVSQSSVYSNLEFHQETKITEVIEEPKEESKVIVSEKAKTNVWQFLQHKTPDRSLPKTQSDHVTSEEKRERMRNNDHLDPSEIMPKDENAVVSKLMVIRGDIKVDTPLLLAGKVIGNIECGDHIEISNNGSVEGNVIAKSINLMGGNIKGNITCEGTLETDEDTIITGDINTAIALISGEVTGEIRAKESVTLASTSVIKGDLISAIIGVEKGASLEGKYIVSSSGK